MKVKLFPVVTLVLIGLLAGQSAQAATVTFNVGGLITSISEDAPVLGASVRVGDAWSISYTFDSTTPDRVSDDPKVGSYSLSAGGISVIHVGRLVVAPDGGSGYIGVYDGDYWGNDVISA